MSLFNSEKEFWSYFEKFNALYGYANWRPTNAKKVHEDIFGVQISKNDVYFKMEGGGGWGTDTKLSRLSMENVLFVVIGLNPGLEDLGQKMHDDHLKRLASCANNSSHRLQPIP